MASQELASSGGFLGKLTRTAIIAVVCELDKGTGVEWAQGWCNAMSKWLLLNRLCVIRLVAGLFESIKKQVPPRAVAIAWVKLGRAPGSRRHFPAGPA